MMRSSKFNILLFGIITCFIISCNHKNTKNNISSIDTVSTSVAKARGWTVRSDSDSLIIYTPKYTTIDLVCGTMPSENDSNFLQTFPVTGLKEYTTGFHPIGMDIDAGPIILNLSPSGTAFFIGCATEFDDKELRTKFLRTAEIAGSTLTWNGRSHYWLANIALVGESIALAMRTTIL